MTEAENLKARELAIKIASHLLDVNSVLLAENDKFITVLLTSFYRKVQYKIEISKLDKGRIIISGQGEDRTFMDITTDYEDDITTVINMLDHK